MQGLSRSAGRIQQMRPVRFVGAAKLFADIGKDQIRYPSHRMFLQVQQISWLIRRIPIAIIDVNG
jgi:hypothetical protein